MLLAMRKGMMKEMSPERGLRHGPDKRNPLPRLRHRERGADAAGRLRVFLGLPSL
jgi:hypothetical protein